MQGPSRSLGTTTRPRHFSSGRRSHVIPRQSLSPRDLVLRCISAGSLAFARDDKGGPSPSSGRTVRPRHFSSGRRGPVIPRQVLSPRDLVLRCISAGSLAFARDDSAVRHTPLGTTMRPLTSPRDDTAALTLPRTILPALRPARYSARLPAQRSRSPAGQSNTPADG